MRRVIKGIVMEVKSNNAIVMTNDGEFVRVKKPSSNVILGEEITSTEYVSSRPNLLKYGILAALIMLLLIPFSYFKQAYATVAYVNVDINPSLEMGINKFNKVNSITPLNTDAEKLLGDIKLKGLDINEALDRVITTAKTMGYISDEKENNIEIALVRLKGSNPNVSEKFLVKHAEETVTSIDVDATIKVQKADEKTYTEAKKENLSTNKYLDKKGSDDKDTIKVNVKKSNDSKDKNQDKNNGSSTPQGSKGSENNGNSNGSSGNKPNNNGVGSNEKPGTKK